MSITSKNKMISGEIFLVMAALPAKESSLGKSRIVSVVAWQDQGISVDLVGWITLLSVALVLAGQAVMP